MTSAATDDEDLQDLRLKAAMYDHLMRENDTLRGQIATLEGVQAGTQHTLDLVTNDLKKRGEQIGQAMLNLAEIAGASKQQTTAMQSLTTQLGVHNRQVVEVLRALVPEEADDASE